MGYTKTELFNNYCNEKDKYKSLDEELKDKELEEQKDRDETDSCLIKRVGKKLILNKIGKSWSSNFKSILLSKGEKDCNYFEKDIEEIYIFEFTGDVEDLMNIGDEFCNLKTIKVDYMLSTSCLHITKNHKTNYDILISKSSVFDMKLNKDFIMPKVKIEKSLMPDSGVFEKFVIIENVEDWVDSKLKIGGTEFKNNPEFKIGKRFNKVDIFNRLFGTKLRSLHNMEFNFKFQKYPWSKSEITSIVKNTNYGYIFTSDLNDVMIIVNLKHGDYEIGPIECHPIGVKEEEKEWFTNG